MPLAYLQSCTALVVYLHASSYSCHRSHVARVSSVDTEIDDHDITTEPRRSLVTPRSPSTHYLWLLSRPCFTCGACVIAPSLALFAPQARAIGLVINDGRRRRQTRSPRLLSFPYVSRNRHCRCPSPCARHLSVHLHAISLFSRLFVVTARPSRVSSADTEIDDHDIDRVNPLLTVH